MGRHTPGARLPTTGTSADAGLARLLWPLWTRSVTADRLDLDAIRNEADNQERLFGGYGDTGDWYYAANRAVANTRRLCDEVERLQAVADAAREVWTADAFYIDYGPDNLRAALRRLREALDALDGD